MNTRNQELTKIMKWRNLYSNSLALQEFYCFYYLEILPILWRKLFPCFHKNFNSKLHFQEIFIQVQVLKLKYSSQWIRWMRLFWVPLISCLRSAFLAVQSRSQTKFVVWHTLSSNKRGSCASKGISNSLFAEIFMEIDAHQKKAEEEILFEALKH